MSVSNRICALLKCEHPIVLAGMGGPSRSELVAAVTAAGGFGFLGMVRERPKLIRQEVETLRHGGHSHFGVNIIPAATKSSLLREQLDTIIDLRVPVVALFWDLDAAVVARLRQAGIIVVYQVGSVEEAVAVERAGAQMIVAQGREAGGHVRSKVPLRHLLPAVAAAVDTPVLAAGGLASGGDLLVAQALGAEGIMLGTRFLASKESFAHPHHKQRLIVAEPRDTLLTELFHINWPPGASVRVISSVVTQGAKFHDNDEARTVIGEEAGRPIYLFSTDSPLQSMTGDFESMALYAGTGVGKVKDVRPAADILEEITRDAAILLDAADPDIQPSSPVRYASEISGAYTGHLEPHELALEVSALLTDLRGLLRTLLDVDRVGKGDGPSFGPDVVPIARWVTKLTLLSGVQAGKGEQPGRASRAEIRARILQLSPLLPNGRLRTHLAALRDWLD